MRRFKKNRRYQIRTVLPHEGREFLFYLLQSNKIRGITWLKFHQDIHITIRPKIFAEDGAEECRPLDMMPAAETAYFFRVNGYFGAYFSYLWVVFDVSASFGAASG